VELEVVDRQLRDLGEGCGEAAAIGVGLDADRKAEQDAALGVAED
jgi:hypothetical protein